MSSNQKILISACLLGDRVRYDGLAKRVNHPILDEWLKKGLLLKVCPEVLGGLPTPREPAEIKLLNGQTKVMTKNGSDVTNAFRKGALDTSYIAKTNAIKIAILKENSPSCGSKNIYDGTHQGNLIPGQGLTTRALTTAGVKVFNEHELEAAATYLKQLGI